MLASPDSAIRPERAANDLRREVATASLVVCHGSGSWIVLFLVLAGWAERPPVVLVEARCPAFWCGVAIGEVVVHGAVEAMALGVERRCIAVSRGVVVEPEELRSSELAAMLGAFGEHARPLGPPRLPTAVLPAGGSAVDESVLSRQVSGGEASGVSGSLHRWPLPTHLRDRCGWVIIGRDSDRVLMVLQRLLDSLPDVFPDTVVVNAAAYLAIDDLAFELADVVELVSVERPVDDDTASAMGRRHLVGDRTLVVSDDVPLLRPDLLGLLVGELGQRADGVEPVGLSASNVCRLMWTHRFGASSEIRRVEVG